MARVEEDEVTSQLRQRTLSQQRSACAAVEQHVACGSPFPYRKAGSSAFLRELLILFGNSGYVALFEIEDASTVTILAVRHQLEDDYH